jgi:hypothetical protein
LGCWCTWRSRRSAARLRLRTASRPPEAARAESPPRPKQPIRFQRAVAQESVLLLIWEEPRKQRRRNRWQPTESRAPGTPLRHRRRARRQTDGIRITDSRSGLTDHDPPQLRHGCLARDTDKGGYVNLRKNIRESTRFRLLVECISDRYPADRAQRKAKVQLVRVIFAFIMPSFRAARTQGVGCAGRVPPHSRPTPAPTGVSLRGSIDPPNQLDKLRARIAGGAQIAMRKLTVEECITIPATALKGASQRVALPAGTERLAVSGIDALKTAGAFEDPVLTLSWTGPNGSTERRQFGLVRTRPHFGGVRWWFRCVCGLRVGRLYLPRATAAPFACRTCHNLTYRSSQTHNARLDALRRHPEVALESLHRSRPSAKTLVRLLRALAPSSRDPWLPSRARRAADGRSLLDNI